MQDRVVVTQVSLARGGFRQLIEPGRTFAFSDEEIAALEQFNPCPVKPVPSSLAAPAAPEPRAPEGSGAADIFKPHEG